jgi:hypothetical protein
MWMESNQSLNLDQPPNSGEVSKIGDFVNIEYCPQT